VIDEREDLVGEPAKAYADEELWWHYERPSCDLRGRFRLSLPGGDKPIERLLAAFPSDGADLSSLPMHDSVGRPIHR
jgi:hypothetical protein